MYTSLSRLNSLVQRKQDLRNELDSWEKLGWWVWIRFLGKVGLVFSFRVGFLTTILKLDLPCEISIRIRNPTPSTEALCCGLKLNLFSLLWGTSSSPMLEREREREVWWGLWRGMSDGYLLMATVFVSTLKQ